MKPNIKVSSGILSKALGVFTLSFWITLIVSSYFLVALLFFVKGRESAQNELLSYFKRSQTSVYSPSPAPISIAISPTKSPALKAVIPKQIKSWGGPELWISVNKKRVEYGVNPLQQKDELCTIASIRLNELLDLGKLDNHEGFSDLQKNRSDLKWIFDEYAVLAEFLALGGDTSEETVELWNNTLGHKKLLTGGEYVWGCIYAQNKFAVAITAY